ncbi:OX-2 membrane glycoprotein-like [Fundulus heteroclitus]|uniref:OX-2 membrane glycoprotein-like n=1 Tax=Fundulus heteroclitus TaxID=8078 RepID=UPI00165ACF43|nr:OX-2 membrane glycoprotein-like [Fundulus heteroclitus]
MRTAFLIGWFLINAILQTGQLALIETEETVWAAVGDQASLSCQLTGNREVLQVTWQKLLSDGEINLATYTKKFGSRVSAGLKEKMDFQYNGLQSCSMVIRKVTEQDEGCYRCLFNTYPLGALIGRTCLRLSELHGPVLDVSRSSSPAGSVVSCSATGRPAPTVTLTAPQQNLSLSLYNTTRVSNSNGTVTVTTTALLSASSSTQVGCSVSVLSAAPRELLLTVPGPSHTSDHEFWVIAGLVVMLCVAAVAVFIPVLFRKKAENRKPRSLDGVPKSLDSCLKDLLGKKQSPSDNAAVSHIKPACGDSGEENFPLTRRKPRRLDEDLDPQQLSAIDELLGTLESGDTHRESEDTLNKPLVEELPVVAITINFDYNPPPADDTSAIKNNQQ